MDICLYLIVGKAGADVVNFVHSQHKKSTRNASIVTIISRNLFKWSVRAV